MKVEKFKTKVQKNESIEWASEAGRTAFHDGKMAAPCLNKQFIEDACEKYTGKALIEMLSAYSKAWHTENANAPY